MYGKARQQITISRLLIPKLAIVQLTYVAYLCYSNSNLQIIDKCDSHFTSLLNNAPVSHAFRFCLDFKLRNGSAGSLLLYWVSTALLGLYCSTAARSFTS